MTCKPFYQRLSSAGLGINDGSHESVKVGRVGLESFTIAFWFSITETSPNSINFLEIRGSQHIIKIRLLSGNTIQLESIESFNVNLPSSLQVGSKPSSSQLYTFWYSLIQAPFPPTMRAFT